MQGRTLVIILIALTIIGAGLAWYFLKDIEPNLNKAITYTKFQNFFPI